MLKEVKMYTVICDNCGKDSNEGCEYAAWNDKFYAQDVAMDSGWTKEDDMHYCSECFAIRGDEDNLN